MFVFHHVNIDHFSFEHYNVKGFVLQKEATVTMW